MAALVKTARKFFSVDERVMQALSFLARDKQTGVDALVDEAFRDLLKKHKRPLTLKAALQESARTLPANDPGPKRAKAK